MASALRLRPLDDRRWSLLLLWGFLQGFLLPLLCASCCCFWLSFSASGCSSAGSTFLFSLWVCGSRVGLCCGGFGGLVIASGSSAFLLTPFLCFRPSTALLCALSGYFRLRSFCLRSWSLGGSVHCFWLRVRVVGSLSLSLFPRYPYLGLLFVPRPLLLLSLSAFGYPSDVPFAPSWRLLRLPWRWLQILRLGCLLPYLAPFVLSLTACASLLFELFSRLLARRSLLLLLVRSLCSSFPLRCLLYSRSLLPGSSGFALPSLRLFSCIASFLAGNILGYSFAFSHCPVFCCYCGFAGFCFSCPPLFAGQVRPTFASLSLLLGHPFRGPALVGSSSQALSESLSHAMWLFFPIFGVFSGFRLCSFCRSAASLYVAYSCHFSLLLSLLLVSVPCLRLLWFAPPRCLQCLLSFVSCLTRSPSLLCGLCRLEWLWPLPAPVLAVDFGVLLFRRLSLLLVVVAGPRPLTLALL